MLASNEDKPANTPVPDEALKDDIFDPATEGELPPLSMGDAKTLSQIWMGQIATLAVFGSLVLVVIGAFTLAIIGRSAEYVTNVLGALQPFLLPAIAAIVGYALGRRDRDAE